MPNRSRPNGLTRGPKAGGPGGPGSPDFVVIEKRNIQSICSGPSRRFLDLPPPLTQKVHFTLVGTPLLLLICKLFGEKNLPSLFIGRLQSMKPLFSHKNV